MQFLTKRTLLPFLALGMVATSCQDEDFGFTQQDVKLAAYGRAFDEMFANVDTRVFQGILDNELDLQVNIPGNFTLYITQGYCSGDPACNVLYEMRPGIEGDGNCYVQNFSAPSEIDAVYVSLVTENYEVWSKKVAIQDGKCTAVFGEAATTRGATNDWSGLTSGHHYLEWTRWEDDTHTTILDELAFSAQECEYFTQLISAEYLIAWEDLGGDFDFDFNDLVMKVRRDFSDMSKFQVEVQVLAAGGTMPIAIGCNAKKGAYPGSEQLLITFNGEKDIHKAWGVEEDVRVNTVFRESEPNYENLKDLFVMDKEPLKATIEMNVENIETTTLASVMNKFFITRKNGFYNPNASNKNDWAITAPFYLGKKEGLGKACQGIVIANCNWVWPEEHNFILDKYPILKDWNGNTSVQYSNTQNPFSIWSGTDKYDYNVPEATFANMLNAQWNVLRKGYGSPYNGNVYSFWHTDNWGQSHYVMDMQFEEILDYNKTADKKYFVDEFEAYQPFYPSYPGNWITASSQWHAYDVPFKSRRVYIPYSKVKDYRYRYEGKAPTDKDYNGNDIGHNIYHPGDEAFVIAIVMTDRPWNEEDALFLSTGSTGPDVDCGDKHYSITDGRSRSAVYEKYAEGKSAVDIYFAEVFLQNMNFTETDGNKYWDYATPSDPGTDARALEDYRWGQLKPDYTIFTPHFPEEEMVFPYDLMISPYNYGRITQELDEEGNIIVSTSTQLQSCVKVPEAKFYKIFVGRPTDRSQYKPTPVTD